MQARRLLTAFYHIIITKSVQEKSLCHVPNLRNPQDIYAFSGDNAARTTCGMHIHKNSAGTSGAILPPLSGVSVFIQIKKCIVPDLSVRLIPVQGIVIGRTEI